MATRNLTVDERAALDKIIAEYDGLMAVAVTFEQTQVAWENSKKSIAAMGVIPTIAGYRVHGRTEDACWCSVCGEPMFEAEVAGGSEDAPVCVSCVDEGVAG